MCVVADVDVGDENVDVAVEDNVEVVETVFLFLSTLLSVFLKRPLSLDRVLLELLFLRLKTFVTPLPSSSSFSPFSTLPLLSIFFSPSPFPLFSFFPSSPTTVSASTTAAPVFSFKMVFEFCWVFCRLVVVVYDRRQLSMWRA